MERDAISKILRLQGKPLAGIICGNSSFVVVVELVMWFYSVTEYVMKYSTVVCKYKLQSKAVRKVMHVKYRCSLTPVNKVVAETCVVVSTVLYLNSFFNSFFHRALYAVSLTGGLFVQCKGGDLKSRSFGGTKEKSKECILLEFSRWFQRYQTYISSCSTTPSRQTHHLHTLYALLQLKVSLRPKTMWGQGLDWVWTWTRRLYFLQQSSYGNAGCGSVFSGAVWADWSALWRFCGTFAAVFVLSFSATNLLARLLLYYSFFFFPDLSQSQIVQSARHGSASGCFFYVFHVPSCASDCSCHEWDRVRQGQGCAECFKLSLSWPWLGVWGEMELFEERLEDCGRVVELKKRYRKDLLKSWKSLLLNCFVEQLNSWRHEDLKGRPDLFKPIKHAKPVQATFSQI